MAFYNPILVGVHVLLVDSEMNDLLYSAKLLQDNSYRVTALWDIPSASSMLTQSDTKFDVLMLDTNSSDPRGFDFMHKAINKGLIVILMCAKADAHQVKFAIEDGAFLVMEKPISVEEMKNLWQHVLREKARKSKETLLTGETSLGLNNQNHSNDTTKGTSVNRDASMNKVTSQKGAVEYPNLRSSNGDHGAKPKSCMVWTPELHEKFVAAIRQLGDGRCFPKDILETMNVPELTRMQVASHLQKCRLGVQLARHKKPSHQSPMLQLSKPREFGLSPFITKGSEDGRSKDNSVEQLMPINGGAPNIGQQAALCGTRAGMNEFVSSENMIGNNFVLTPPQGPQINVPIADDDFDLQQFDCDYHVSEVQARTDAGEEEPSNPANPWI